MGFLMLAVLVRVGTSRQVVFTMILSGPAVIAVTYFAVGGRIPSKLVGRGLHPWGVIMIVAWIGIFMAIFTDMLFRR